MLIAGPVTLSYQLVLGRGILPHLLLLQSLHLVDQLGIAAAEACQVQSQSLQSLQWLHLVDQLGSAAAEACQVQSMNVQFQIPRVLCRRDPSKMYTRMCRCRPSTSTTRASRPS